MRKRMLSQDIAKGLGILFVVQLHGLQLTKAFFYSWAALTGFSMPFFFFASGYNYRSKGLSPVQSMKKRVLALLKTYICWTLGVFIVMGIYFLVHKDGSLSEILKSFAGAVLSESGCKMIGWKLPVALYQHVLGPYWFLQFLITASAIFYLVADYTLRSFQRTISVIILLSGITFLFVQFRFFLPWGMHVAPVIAAIMIAGAKLGKDNRFFDSSPRKAWTVINSVVSLVIVELIQGFYPAAGILGAGLLGETAGGIEILFAFCFAVFGSYFLVNFGKLLEKIPVVSKGLIWCGQHSLIILVLHRPVAYIIRDVMGLPHFISGNPLYIERTSFKDVIAFLMIFVIMVPVITAWDQYKKKRQDRDRRSHDTAQQPDSKTESGR